MGSYKIYNINQHTHKHRYAANIINNIYVLDKSNKSCCFVTLYWVNCMFSPN